MKSILLILLPAILFMFFPCVSDAAIKIEFVSEIKALSAKPSFKELGTGGKIDVDKDGNLYVIDFKNSYLKKYSPEGELIKSWIFKNPNFRFPIHPYIIAINRKDNKIYLADCLKFFVEFIPHGNDLGELTKCKFGDKHIDYMDISVDELGNVYFSEPAYNRIQKFSSDGKLLLMLGGYYEFSSKPGKFNFCTSATGDKEGNVYVLDSNNNRIQKFTPDGKYLKKWGGTGTWKGRFRYPIAIAIDNSNYLYVADYHNHRIQVFTLEGKFVTSWGKFGSKQGEFKGPMDIAIDSNNNIYVVDEYNSRIQKFKIKIEPKK